MTKKKHKGNPFKRHRTGPILPEMKVYGSRDLVDFINRALRDEIEEGDITEVPVLMVHNAEIRKILRTSSEQILLDNKVPITEENKRRIANLSVYLITKKSFYRGEEQKRVETEIQVLENWVQNDFNPAYKKINPIKLFPDD